MKIVFMLLLAISFTSCAGTDKKLVEVPTEHITLTSSNLVWINTQIDDGSVSKAITELAELDKLQTTEPVYLFLETPGGSIDAGMSLIEFTKGMKRPVHSIVKQAASMGFIINMYLPKRYILSSGTLMSHRAKAGIQGQVYGELETRLEALHDYLTLIESHVAKRMGVSLTDYRTLVREEFYATGADAINHKVSDVIAEVSCDSTLDPKPKSKEVKRTITLEELFTGRFAEDLRRCPMH
jgi:ATP-dependent Clp protease, protease subunit